jgi:uncharacterized Zn-finger protein
MPDVQTSVDVPTESAVICPTCNREFASKRSLAAHRRVHDAPEKSFHCSFCTRAFARSSNLKKHFQVAHGEQLVVVSSDPTTTTISSEQQADAETFTQFTFDKSPLMDNTDIEMQQPAGENDHHTPLFEVESSLSVHDELIRLRAQNELLTSQMLQLFALLAKK